MPKFSVVVPIYNTSKYLEKCLDSIINQTYKDFEIIAVNDGSTDNSEEIIDKYTKKNNNIKKVNKQNGGISDTRNEGITHAIGEYLILIDSDDYIHNEMFEKINEIIKRDESPDVIKFCNYEEENGKVYEKLCYTNIKNENGVNALAKIIENKDMYVMPWLYAYKRSFWLENEFKYAKGRLHEDFGITLLIIMNANTVTTINDKLYYYIKREGSLSVEKNYEKIKKNTFDIIYHFDFLSKKIIDNKNIKKEHRKMFLSHIANYTLLCAKLLNKEDLNTYIQELKNRNIPKLLANNTFGQKIKKVIITLNMKLYIKVFI